MIEESCNGYCLCCLTGNDLQVDVKTERDFYAHRMCQTSLGLKKDKLYLFIGNPKDIIVGDDGRLGSQLLCLICFLHYMPHFILN